MNQRSFVSIPHPVRRGIVCSLAGSTSAVPFGRIHHKSLGTMALMALVIGALVLPVAATPPTGEPGTPAPQAEGTPKKTPATPSEKDGKKDPATPKNTDTKTLKLPGLVVDMEKKCVDVEASICLVDGALELIACTKDTKEHESIVVIAARPAHIHAALLLLGAKNGNPAMRRAIDKEQTRWVDIPPRGDLIEVFLEYKDIEGKLVERPITDFITHSDEPQDNPGASPPDKARPEKFPNSFIFAGSQIDDPGPGKGERQYIADQSGDVISIATFGDELLCLPEVHSQENGALVWSVDTTHIPKLGTKVTLRLRPAKKP